jgi:hypothetical protein
MLALLLLSASLASLLPESIQLLLLFRLLGLTTAGPVGRDSPDIHNPLPMLLLLLLLLVLLLQATAMAPQVVLTLPLLVSRSSSSVLLLLLLTASSFVRCFHRLRHGFWGLRCILLLLLLGGCSLIGPLLLLRPLSVSRQTTFSRRILQSFP